MFTAQSYNGAQNSPQSTIDVVLVPENISPIKPLDWSTKKYSTEVSHQLEHEPNLQGNDSNSQQTPNVDSGAHQNLNLS